MTNSLVLPDDGVALVGDLVRFDVRVLNSGPTTLSSLILTDAFDNACLSFEYAIPSPDAVAGTSVSWNTFTPLYTGESQVFQVYFTSLTPCVPANTNASVSGSDENTVSVSDGPANASVVISNPELTISKHLITPMSGPYLVGDTLTFQIDLTNIGTSNITTLPLSDQYGNFCMEFLDATPSMPDGSGGGTLLWDNLGTLNAGNSMSLTTRFVVINGCSPVENLAIVSFAIDENGDAVPSVQDDAEVIIDVSPIADDDYDETYPGVPVVVSVLDNDVDFNGNFDVSSINNSDVLQPSNGEVTINGTTGNIIYTPYAVTTDFFEYIICDSTNLCDTALVTIEVLHRDEVCGNAIDDDGDGFTDEECSQCECSDLSNCGLIIHLDEATAMTEISSDLDETATVPNGFFDLRSYNLFNDEDQSHEICVTYMTDTETQIGIRNVMNWNDDCSSSARVYSITELDCSTSSASFVGEDINGGTLGIQYYNVNTNTSYRICLQTSFNNSDSDCDNAQSGEQHPELYSTLTHVFPLASVEICDDNIDNDLDGLIDCADPDCGGSSLVTQSSSNVPISIPFSSTGTVTSTLTISQAGAITDINILDLNISHTYIDDLNVWLTSPEGTSVTVLSRPCTSQNNVFMDFDDEAASSSYPCPPTNGLAYIPANALSAFDGENMQGLWTLYVQDVYTADGGSINGWTLEIESACPTEICDNGIDDDGDGLIDCDDPECQFTKLFATTTPVGCIDGGTIDLTTIGGVTPYHFEWNDMVSEANWTFENTTNDISLNNHHDNGITGTAIYSADAIEGETSFSFNGATYIRYSVDNNFMETAWSEASFSAWIKPTNLIGLQTIFDEGSATSGFSIRLSANVLQTAVSNLGEQVLAGALTFPNDGAWHHIAAVFDKGNLTLYLDGIAGIPTNASFSSVALHTGNGGLGYLDGGSAFGSNSGEYFNGLMDDVRYFSNALTEDQIIDIARNDGDRNGLEADTYSVTVTTAVGCSEVETATLNSFNLINGLIVNVTTDGADTNPGDGICDDGDCNCSLRAAIEETNALAGYDTIYFDIPGIGSHTIQPLSDLPSITEGVYIDGYSQSGAKEATVSTAANIEIIVNGANMSSSWGILHASADNCQIRGLVLNGHTGNLAAGGVTFTGDGNTVAGCHIGTDETGILGIANSHGVRLFGAQNSTIGGVNPEDRNIISGNTYSGVFCEKNGTSRANYSHVEGNYIGTDATGTLGLGNGENGIDFGNSIGGMAIDNVIADNGSNGIEIDGMLGELSQAIIQGNNIGTDKTGAIDLGNNNRGIFLTYTANTDIGGINSGDENIIANNGGAGIEITREQSDGNIILKNSIYNNIGIGIDLAIGSAGDGVTANDINDSDSGANQYLNYPENITFLLNGSNIDCFFDLDVPIGDYRVEFFKNSMADPSGHGEGEIWIASANIYHSGAGTANFSGSFTPPIPLFENDILAMTITECTDGTCTAFVETSEFSGTSLVEDCINYTDPGIISGAESECGGFDPDVISGITNPAGGSGGTQEFQWEISEDDGSTWSPISGAILASYDPTIIAQTTYYRRGAKRSTCPDLIYSNTVIN